MTVETLLFPVGPLEVGGLQKVGVLVCTPGNPVEPVWGDSWEDTFDRAIKRVPDDKWITVKRMADLIPNAEARVRDLRADHAIELARLVGDLADHVGFGSIKSDFAGYEIMRAMAEFLTAAAHMKDARSQPVIIDIHTANEHTMYAGAIGRDGGGAYIYVTQDPPSLVKLIETAFGAELPAGVAFYMARVDADDGWIGSATKDLFGVAFKPMMRTHMADGSTHGMSPDSLRDLTLPLFRAADIASGSAATKGRIKLHDGSYEVEMERFDPQASSREL